MSAMSASQPPATSVQPQLPQAPPDDMLALLAQQLAPMITAIIRRGQASL